eukprot:Nk52_evm12s168 gene=Nk52_evmTU12s168
MGIWFGSGKTQLNKRPSDTSEDLRDIENGVLRHQRSFRDSLLSEIGSFHSRRGSTWSGINGGTVVQDGGCAVDHHERGKSQVEAMSLKELEMDVDRSLFRSVSFGAGTEIDLEYPSNIIKTTKYNFYSFLPMNLYEQFKRIANVYFVLIAILNCLPAVSSFSPGLGFFPVVFVLAVTAVKDWWEDHRRYKSDRETNNRKCRRYEQEMGSFEEVIWQELYAGHIVRVERDGTIPGDMVVLCSSNDDNMCYVETMNLDGETNLKQRFVPAELVGVFDGMSALGKVSGRIDCDLPNNKIYNFSGCMVLNSVVDGKIEDGQDIPLDAGHLLLRDTILRNTDWAIGVVVYAGADTKAVQNNTGVRFKRSKAESDINGKLVLMFVVLVVLSTLGAICSYVFLSDKWGTGATYLFPDADPYSPSTQAFLNFLTFVIILQYVIPISLYVAIEVVKLGQVYFIMNDVELYDETKDQPIEVLALNITEDLGQIDYVFSDKTGTLTENKMDFKICSIYGHMYEHRENANTDGAQEHEFVRDGGLMKALEVKSEREDDFMHALALCNTSVPSSKEGILFESESPDEAALVKTAYLYGYQLMNRTINRMCVKVGEKIQEYKILALLPFDSTRKRMSVLVENEVGGVTLLCKGADSAMLDVLHPGQEEVIETTKKHLHDFSVAGLRTLVIGKAEISQKFLKTWLPKYHEASSLIEDREETLGSLVMQMESHITLLGATGIEDKLQEGVPESIESLRRAGIKVWVLTGDKQETAMNIAGECKLFYEGMEVIVLEANSNDEYIEAVNKLHKKICVENETKKPYGMVVSGSVIAYALEEENQALFVDIACDCVSVLVCRSTPSQKASIVRLVKEHKDKMTLAIGDGANDVGMIQTANIGIGIAGQEGMQAKMASDFAIGQFRFLTRLLLVHGHWCYDRLAYMLLYFFYKSLALVMVNFWFQIYCGFSAQFVFEPLFPLTFNLCWTSWPPVMLGILDQDMSDRTLQREPELYRISQFGKIFTSRRFWLTMLHAVYQSLAIFFVAYATYRGSDTSLWVMSVTIQSSLVIVVSLTLAMEYRRWNWLMHFMLWTTLFVYFVYQLVYNALPIFTTSTTFAGYWSMEMAMQTANYWFSVTMAVVIAMTPSFVYKFSRHFYFPHELDFLREQEKIGRHERRRERRNNVRKEAELVDDAPILAEFSADMQMPKKEKSQFHTV